MPSDGPVDFRDRPWTDADTEFGVPYGTRVWPIDGIRRRGDEWRLETHTDHGWPIEFRADLVVHTGNGGNDA